ncbi:MAG TPA: hypothetical protein VF193_10835 [Steroidobacter sp.]
MNVRFSDRAVRCRVTRAELDRLLSGRAVSLDLALPRDHWFRVNVRPAALNGWQLDSDPTGLWLAIPRSELQELAQSLPDKQGIRQSFDTSAGEIIAVTFEVDVEDETSA